MRLDTNVHVACGIEEAAAVRFDEALALASKKEAIGRLGYLCVGLD